MYHLLPSLEPFTMPSRLYPFFQKTLLNSYHLTYKNFVEVLNETLHIAIDVYDASSADYVRR